jgi:hypothetical protein
MSLEEDYATALELVNDAAFLRKYGERAPGNPIPPHEPTWADWEFVSEMFLNRVNREKGGATNREQREGFIRT